MNHTKEKHIFLMRHGRPDFNYENCTYDELMDMLNNGRDKPLAKEHNINFDSFPQHVDLVCYSSYKRARQTAEELKKHLNVKALVELDLLDEVRFDRGILRKEEYSSIKDSRETILTRWFDDKNQIERFDESTKRVKAIESFLYRRKEKYIIVVTHGWLLRLLEFHFAHGKCEDIRLDELLRMKPMPLGGHIRVALKRKNVFKKLSSYPQTVLSKWGSFSSASRLSFL